MAYSGTISTTSFNTNRVIDTAFRRCRLPAQAITAEMQQYARDALYLILSDLPNQRQMSWCFERVILPMYRGQPEVTLPLGTIDLQAVNYRTSSQVTTTDDLTTQTATQLTYEYAEPVVVALVGVVFNGTTGDVTVETSDDGVSWTTVGTIPGGASGEIGWIDITPSVSAYFLRFTNATALNVSSAYVGNRPSEIPLGRINQDTYTAQNNRIFEGRPTTYWFQRDILRPVIQLWSAPNTTASLSAQLVVWRQRHIMDVGTLRQDIEVPQRWFDAICTMLAAKVALETPIVPMDVVMMLKNDAAMAKQVAYDGDSDGAPTMIQPYISGYTR